MPYSMIFYQDQLVAGGRTDAPLPAAHRLLYVRHGDVVANGRPLAADASAYFDGVLELAAGARWSEVWRFEIAQPNADPVRLAGAGVLSALRLARVVTTLELIAGGQWLFRLDRITSAPGRVTPRHQHHGPGIRVLYQGTFNVQDASHVVSDRVPGEPWWESGAETVVAWHSRQMPAVFVRAMILPVALEGVISNVWKSDGPPPKADWTLFEDRVITL